jgi:hypothetical protein
MKRFSNPLDNIRIASPCSADWDQMYGNHRRRFCADCKLNVYNLSEMTRKEAENFLMSSEGRVCVRFYQRRDGTVLTNNCPVGWKATVHRASRAVTASFSLIAGLFLGLLGMRGADSLVSILPIADVPPVEEEVTRVVAGGLDRDSLIIGESEAPTAGEPDLTDFRRARAVNGRVANIEQFRDRKVVAWIK